MDGQFHAIEFDPSATADEVLKLVKAKIGLRDSAQGKYYPHTSYIFEKWNQDKKKDINTMHIFFHLGM